MIDFNQQTDAQSLLEEINQIEGEEIFSVLDIELAKATNALLKEQSAFAQNWISIATAQCHRILKSGHTSLDLNNPIDLPNALPEWPDTEYWKTTLAALGPSNPKALFICNSGQNLYLRRMWNAETQLAQTIAGFSKTISLDQKSLSVTKTKLLEGCSIEQQQAIQSVENKSFILLSGGPGTGKTFTVLRSILSILLENPNAEIALAAPTGKAVARLIESINNGLESIKVEACLKAKVPKSVETIHRFLMSREQSNKLELTPFPKPKVDWLFIDEVSMVDLPLMNRLLSTIHPTTKVFMLGDINQLASVQPGSVFGDIYRSIQSSDTGRGWFSIELRQGHRFKEDSPIHRLCEATKDGDIDLILNLLEEPNPDVKWFDPSDDTIHQQLQILFDEVLFQAAIASEPETALKKFKQLMILSAVNKGQRGVEKINKQLLRKLQHSCLQKGFGAFWTPIIITENDYQLSLFNGDLALQKRSTQTGQTTGISFYEKESQLVQINSAQLPSNNPAFCLSIHKSQGSEAEEVLLLLPDAESPILSRELFYTAISRAKMKLTIVSGMDSINKCVSSPTQRSSRLKNQISTALVEHL